jgi:hypothetical protein
LLSGVDLGHGSNGVVELIVTVGVSAPISVSATLDGITNSRDCSLVCFRHTGTVDN